MVQIQDKFLCWKRKYKKRMKEMLQIIKEKLKLKYLKKMFNRKKKKKGKYNLHDDETLIR